MERTLGLIRLIRQSRRDSGIGFQVNVFKTFSGLGMGTGVPRGRVAIALTPPSSRGVKPPMLIVKPLPMSSGYVIHQTVKARFWHWLSGKSFQNCQVKVFKRGLRFGDEGLGERHRCSSGASGDGIDPPGDVSTVRCLNLVWGVRFQTTRFSEKNTRNGALFRRKYTKRCVTRTRIRETVHHSGKSARNGALFGAETPDGGDVSTVRCLKLFGVWGLVCGVCPPREEPASGCDTRARLRTLTPEMSAPSDA